MEITNPTNFQLETDSRTIFVFLFFFFFANVNQGLKESRDLHQWRSQEFRSGEARLKNKIESKKLININNKINKLLYDNVIVIQNLT